MNYVNVVNVYFVELEFSHSSLCQSEAMSNEPWQQPVITLSARLRQGYGVAMLFIIQKKQRKNNHIRWGILMIQYLSDGFGLKQKHGHELHDSSASWALVIHGSCKQEHQNKSSPVQCFP